MIFDITRKDCELYARLPLKNKRWFANKDGSIDGILKILEKSEMVESIRFENDINKLNT